MMTSFGLQWWPASVFDCGWLRDEVKSGEEWWRGEPTLHLSEPQCLSGFQTIWWRVKSKSESSLFLSFLLLLLLVASPSSSRRVVSCLAMARNCPGKGQYSAIARQYTLRASLYIHQGHHGDFRVTSWHLVSIIITLLYINRTFVVKHYINRTIVVKPHTPWKG